MTYTPPEDILDKYAQVLINYGLNGGEGIRPGETVYLQVPECAKPLLLSLYKTVLDSEAHALINFIPDGMTRTFFEKANEKQLTYFPEHALKGKLEQMDHVVSIIAETDKHELEGIAPERMMKRSSAFKPYMKWRTDKENRKELTWTLGLYGTVAMATEVGLSEKQYWEQIIKACYLEDDDPVETWRGIQAEVERVKKKLDALDIEEMHVESENIDLWIRLGPNRQWLGGSGKNIPSFEVFISPDWRGTRGHVRFTEPLYEYGNLIEGVELEFEEGQVVKATATRGEDVLQEMINTENADKVGEFSLTDSRLSRITEFMGETLYDENVGGENGNMHIALGKAYQDSYTGDPSTVTDEEWQEMGFNESVVHTDIVNTDRKKVTARLADGSEKVIYEDGKFTI